MRIVDLFNICMDIYKKHKEGFNYLIFGFLATVISLGVYYLLTFSILNANNNIELQNDQLHITLPLPTGKLYIDQSQTEKIAEYQKYYFSGSAEDGFDAYLNTMDKLQKTTADELENYDVLIDSAKESAKKQVSQLATSANIRNRKVVIEFEEEQDNE